MADKKCSSCKVILSKENGYLSNIGLNSHYCKNCHRIKAKKWRNNNKDKSVNHRMKARYGISIQQYEILYMKQNGLCAICEEPNLDGKRFNIDHSHRTNIVRGLLCENCNWLLGNAKDKIQTLYRAADYLERFTDAENRKIISASKKNYFLAMKS